MAFSANYRNTFHRQTKDFCAAVSVECGSLQIWMINFVESLSLPGVTMFLKHFMKSIKIMLTSISVICCLLTINPELFVYALLAPLMDIENMAIWPTNTSTNCNWIDDSKMQNAKWNVLGVFFYAKQHFQRPVHSKMRLELDLLLVAVFILDLSKLQIVVQHLEYPRFAWLRKIRIHLVYLIPAPKEEHLNIFTQYRSVASRPQSGQVQLALAIVNLRALWHTNQTFYRFLSSEVCLFRSSAERYKFYGYFTRKGQLNTLRSHVSYAWMTFDICWTGVSDSKSSDGSQQTVPHGDCFWSVGSSLLSSMVLQFWCFSLGKLETLFSNIEWIPLGL